MTNEQYEKIYHLLTSCVIGVFLSLMLLAIIGVLIFGYIYNQKAYLDDLKRENSIKKDILMKLDKGYFVDESYFIYLREKEERLRKLESDNKS